MPVCLTQELPLAGLAPQHTTGCARIVRRGVAMRALERLQRQDMTRNGARLASTELLSCSSEKNVRLSRV